jgi:hypothetical protein
MMADGSIFAINRKSMRSNHISRKRFLNNTVMAGLGFGIPVSTYGQNDRESPVQPEYQQSVQKTPGSLMLKNVRLETGFEYEGDEVVGTKTELFRIEIVEGRIASILPGNTKTRATAGEANPAGGNTNETTGTRNQISKNIRTTGAPVTDAKGLLMLPSFRDMHIHLDKTFYGGPWKAIRKRQGGVKGMIALEEKILPGMLQTSTERAEKMIGLLQSMGSGFARSHVNIEATSRLESLKNLQKALEQKKAGFGAELVAFPQHGLYYTKISILDGSSSKDGYRFHRGR